MGGVVFGDTMWVIGGYTESGGSGKSFNDVWNSIDGITWKQVTASAPWKARDRTNAVVHNNKLWIIGGTYEPYKEITDVWYSSDGKEWKCATQKAEWGKRMFTQVAIFKNKFYIMGGFSDAFMEFYNEVWSSTDGGTWIKEADPPWSKRDRHGAVVFNDKLWIAGGWEEDGYLLNDVWYCESATGIDKKAVAQPAIAPIVIHSIRPRSSGGPLTMQYTLRHACDVTVCILDCSGKEIGRLWNGVQSAGFHSILWEGPQMSKVGAGTYFVRLKAGGWETNRKIVFCNPVY